MLIFYALLLHQQTEESNQLTLMKFIVKNIYMHSWDSRELIMFLYFKKMVKFSSLSMKKPRKQSFIIRRNMLALQPEESEYFGF
jgi:hypothetical protein